MALFCFDIGLYYEACFTVRIFFLINNNRRKKRWTYRAIERAVLVCGVCLSVGSTKGRRTRKGYSGLSLGTLRLEQVCGRIKGGIVNRDGWKARRKSHLLANYHLERTQSLHCERWAYSHSFLTLRIARRIAQLVAYREAFTGHNFPKRSSNYCDSTIGLPNLYRIGLV